MADALVGTTADRRRAAAVPPRFQRVRAARSNGSGQRAEREPAPARPGRADEQHRRCGSHCTRRENRTLQSLDVRFNDLGDIGTHALAHALRDNPILQNLGVASTELGQTLGCGLRWRGTMGEPVDPEMAGLMGS
eukprot:Skav214652  [mRNA]  locus=scaffold1763:75525:80814:- [translate_table: standard]